MVGLSAAACLIVALLDGCSFFKGLPSVQFNRPFASTDYVDLRDAHVRRGAEPALLVTVANKRRTRIWVRMVIDELEGRNDCVNSFGLDPDESFLYICPQPTIREGLRYRAELTVFRDRGNTSVAERLNRIIEVQRNAEGELVLIGKPAE